MRDVPGQGRMNPRLAAARAPVNRPAVFPNRNRRGNPPMEATHLLDVRPAIEAGRPVVALESTLIAHGLPWPLNLETARAAEAAVREGGATPATIAVWRGRPTVGLNDDELAELSQAHAVLKASRRDLATAVAQ